MVAPAKTLLVTGFGAFPGVAANPTEALIARLSADPPQAGSGVQAHFHLLPVTWAMLEEELPRLYEAHSPAAVVHFGVASRRRMICIETRARNEAAGLDASGASCNRSRLDSDGPAARPATLPVRPLVSAVAASGARVRASRDAGAYLCNATLWTSLARGLPAVFVHVPLPGTGGTDPRPDADALEAAARAVLTTIASHLAQ